MYLERPVSEDSLVDAREGHEDPRDAAGKNPDVAPEKLQPPQTRDDAPGARAGTRRAPEAPKLPLGHPFVVVSRRIHQHRLRAVEMEDVLGVVANLQPADIEVSQWVHRFKYGPALGVRFPLPGGRLHPGVFEERPLASLDPHGRNDVGEFAHVLYRDAPFGQTRLIAYRHDGKALPDDDPGLGPARAPGEEHGGNHREKKMPRDPSKTCGLDDSMKGERRGDSLDSPAEEAAVNHGGSSTEEYGAVDSIRNHSFQPGPPIQFGLQGGDFAFENARSLGIIDQLRESALRVWTRAMARRRGAYVWTQSSTRRPGFVYSALVLDA